MNSRQFQVCAQKVAATPQPQREGKEAVSDWYSLGLLTFA